MAGHSKWHNIMHRKGAQDRIRAGLFTKLAREITMAAKVGDPNPENNPRLRLAIFNARKESMPNDNIKRAIDRATAAGGENYEAVRYEGYGPGAVPVIVEALTDNPRRTVPEVRAIFTKAGGNLGENGSVSYMFSRIGLIVYSLSVAPEDVIFEEILSAGAEDLEVSDDGYTITTNPDNFAQVQQALQNKFGEAEQAKLTWVANAPVEVSGEVAEKLEKFMDAMDDNDDVQNVFVGANFA